MSDIHWAFECHCGMSTDNPVRIANGGKVCPDCWAESGGTAGIYGTGRGEK